MDADKYRNRIVISVISFLTKILFFQFSFSRVFYASRQKLAMQTFRYGREQGAAYFNRRITERM
jgi:hypothetical protein